MAYGNNAVFLELIEWFDPTGDQIAQRIPAEGSGEIKFGAQLVVRESQVGVFFYHGKAIQVFGPGRHTLKTANIPVLNKLMAIPWGMKSPLRAEVYFVNMKVFANLKWGTQQPVAFKDSELGLVRLRAFGQYTIRVVQPLLFINSLVGTLGTFVTDNITGYLSDLVVSRLNDHLGENLDSLLNLPGRYIELGDSLQKRLQIDFGKFGLELPQVYISSITPPEEVQKAIDDRSRLGVLRDLEDLTKLKAAMAIEKAAENTSGTAGQGMGVGMGLMMPGMLARYFQPGTEGAPAKGGKQQCPDCGHKIPADAQFCMYCGHQILVFDKCGKCGKNLPPNARFCMRCGAPAESVSDKSTCPHCGSSILANSVFCNQCGEKV